MACQFIVLSSQRTGSTYLQQCLTTHPALLCRGEILLGYGGTYSNLPTKLLRRFRRLRTLWQGLASGALLFPGRAIQDALYSEIPDEIQGIGFRMMYNQMERDRRVLPELKKIENLKVIHLCRQDKLKQFVSLKLMHDQARYKRFTAHVTSGVEPVCIRIDPEEATSFIRKVEAEHTHYSKVFQQFECLEIKYEEMIGESGLNQAASKAICDFLQVPVAPMLSKQVKMNPDDLSQTVQNFDELRMAVEGMS